MIDSPLTPSTVEQARLELSVAASSAERANRPRILLYGAILLLVIAAIYSLTGLSALRSSLAEVARARRNSDEIVTLVNKVKGLQETFARRGLDPNPRIAVELEHLAQLSGATLAQPITDTPGGAGQGGMMQKRYTARFVNQDPAVLIQFLNLTQEAPETAGVEFARLNLMPSSGASAVPGKPSDPAAARKWNLDVDFTRWERLSRR